MEAYDANVCREYHISDRFVKVSGSSLCDELLKGT